MNIQNLLQTLLTSSKKNWQYIAIVGLAIMWLMSVTTCSKNKSKLTDCEGIELSYEDSISIAELMILNTSTSHIIETDVQPTDTIKDVKIVYRDHSTFVKNWNELQEAKVRIKTLLEENNRISNLLDITRVQFDSIINEEGEFVIETVETVVEPPLVSTRKDEVTEEYEIQEEIWTHGPIQRFDRKITVKPKTITITKKEVEYLKKNKHLAIEAGVLYMGNIKGFDVNDLYYTPTLSYSQNWWTLGGGPLMSYDNSFKVEGLELRGGLVIRLK